MTYSAKSLDPATFTISARGQSGTTATTHAVNTIAYKAAAQGDPLITGATGKLLVHFIFQIQTFLETLHLKWGREYSD